MSATLDKALNERLAQRRAEKLYRKRHSVGSAAGASVRLNGKDTLLFCSNDYLGVANHPKLIEAANQATKRFGAGSGASHLVSGHSDYHEQLEQVLAQHTGRDRALLFSTGFMANLGAITALLGKGDFIFEDRLNHASLLDGGLASGAKFQRFHHNDIADLSRRLTKTEGEGNKLVVVDSVFSMDGDCAPLDKLVLLCAANNAWLMADDAHGYGVLGERGAGVAEQYSQQDLPIYMATLGKAMGSFGAFVAGSEALIESLIQFARSYIYTTALPPAVAATSLASLQLLEEEAWRRSHLQTLIQQFRAEAKARNWPLMPSNTAIQPLLVGDADTALKLSEKLLEMGIWVSAIRPPTVPAGTARLRITLSAAHSEAQLECLISSLDSCLVDFPAVFSTDKGNK